MPGIDSYGGSEKWSFDATGYFRLEQASDRWWIADPDGHGFITIGLNHADDSNLKYQHNLDVWKKKYGSKEKWIREGLVKDLRDWGFNTIGWTQDYIAGGWRDAFDWAIHVNIPHSTGWSVADFEAANMPYTLSLRVAEIEDWNGQPAFPDVESREFDEYCAYLARSVCADHAESKNLIGYHLVDVPAWLPHVSGEDFPALKGLDEAERNEKLYDVASKYYETITKHVRAYDSNHLLFGDKYNGDRGIPKPVLDAAAPYIDVLSVQYFPGHNEEARQWLREDMARLHEETGKPLIIPDIGNWTPTELNPNRVSDPTRRLAGMETHSDRATHYIDTMDAVINEPWFLGWHWCAHVENTARGWGLKDPWDEPYQDFVDPISEFNKNVYEKL